MEKMPITEAGYRKLVAEVKQLKSVDRPRIIQEIAKARAHGDLSENAEYHAARDEQGRIEARIKELDNIAAHASIIQVEKIAGANIKFGAHITARDEDTEKKVQWQLVSPYESDIANGLLSIASPIAKAFIGRKKGDVIEVNTPGGSKCYAILKVQYR